MNRLSHSKDEAAFASTTPENHTWGYKVWVLCGASGFAYDFEIYSGKSDNTLLDGEEDCGASGNVVV